MHVTGTGHLSTDRQYQQHTRLGSAGKTRRLGTTQAKRALAKEKLLRAEKEREAEARRVMLEAHNAQPFAERFPPPKDLGFMVKTCVPVGARVGWWRMPRR